MPRYFLAPMKTKETLKIAKNLKRTSEYYPRIIYLNNPRDLEFLSNVIKEKDILEIHADGNPWIMGAQYSTNYDYSPRLLAMTLQKILKNYTLNITIDLRFCNSGTTATGAKGSVCYAESLSKFLSEEKFCAPIVYGYAAFVHSEKPLRQSLVSEHDKHGAKVAHCRLEDGRIVYQNGKKIESPLKTLVTSFEYDADDFLEHEVICQVTPESAKLQSLLGTDGALSDDSIEQLENSVKHLSLEPLLFCYRGSPLMIQSEAFRTQAASIDTAPSAGNSIYRV
ncbi:hypothetical protein CC99x_005420 [Candidatus Berkiella cookevillensis]|uniref:Uncharacterized protein n=1 Tax=Candidatus Berkiella cookevillensis TaxID=437022 RepID=A0A0Q9YTZ8_9GAMM|nr:hypothetical protein [Candidatus Berkiella cookevillensis]MCS5708341.1 hypothetical protein [Candidatus Berkiella cookevillensis]